MATKSAKKTTMRNRRRRGEVPARRDFPAHLNTTPEEWRALKRTEWREVRQALERYYSGSAFTPAQPAFYKIGTLIHQVTEAIEAPDWIAW